MLFLNLEESLDEMPANFYSLSEIPFDKVQDFKVSKLSTFKDILWDWREKEAQFIEKIAFILGTKKFRWVFRLLEMKINTYVGCSKWLRFIPYPKMLVYKI